MKLLFIRFSSLGDVILTTGIIKNLSEKLPGAQIDVLTSSAFADVYRGLGCVDGVFTIERGIKLSKYLEFLNTLPEYDYIFDLHGNARSFFARLRLKGEALRYNKAGFQRRAYVKLRLCGSGLNKHVVQRYAEAVYPPLGLETPSLEGLRPYLPGAGLTDEKKLVLHPFATKYTKIWPGFVELAGRLAKLGWNVKIIGNGEFPDIDSVERVNTPTVKDMLAYMSDARLVVSADSGPLHAAVALGVPVVGIFGGTTRELGFYPAFRGCTVVERNDVPCRPCHIHGRSACPKKHFNCMRLISVEDVLYAIGGSI